MPGSISGQVTDENGAGLPDTVVQAVSGKPIRGKTNAQGNYIITNLNAGSYVVMVTPGAGQYNPPNYQLTLEQNQNMTGVNFTRANQHHGTIR
ncbi:MAG TPA: carboxypeptidase-like regulatory domain-containing protein [Pyrinomonadaceae bacterium]|jgi:hypothetical protein